MERITAVQVEGGRLFLFSKTVIEQREQDDCEDRNDVAQDDKGLIRPGGQIDVQQASDEERTDGKEQFKQQVEEGTLGKETQ